MAAAIREKDVVDVLRPWLGSAFLAATDTAAQLTETLRGYSPFHQSLDDLRDVLDKQLFHLLHTHLGVSMSVQLDSGRIVRIMVRTIEPITDDLLGVLFDSLSVYSVNYEMLNRYALTHESLSSLRVLFQKYRGMMSEDEVEMIVYMIKRTYPKERYGHWLV